MQTVTLSSKYQVVIPKVLRRELNLKSGQKLRLSKNQDGSLRIETKSALDELYGSVKGGWSNDADAFIAKSRDEWEDHQKEIDAQWQK